MNSIRHHSDVLIIGAGPAGMAAAYTASQSGQRVTIVDDNPTPGGQIWRGEARKSASPEAAEWLRKIQDANVSFIHSARVFAQPEDGLLLAETFDGVCLLAYQKLILATGARERFLPFAGWTLPNVMGAGGLQALVKAGLPVKGKKIIVAGSGPLLMAVAAYLQQQDAEVLLIAEQAAWPRLLRFGLGLFTDPGKLRQAVALKNQLTGVKYLTSCWPIAAHGHTMLTQVTMQRGSHTWQVNCDYLACGFHLIPNLELAALLGCEFQNGGVRVDDDQQTSVANTYCAGESTGIGGLDLSLVEGQIAGFAATGHSDKARQLFAARRKARRFADRLNRTFELRAELKALPQADTIICRCEDVTLARLQTQASWRAAKLQTRCGMGPCQGRICGAAVEFLLGWQPESVRPPAFPARIESIITDINQS